MTLAHVTKLLAKLQLCEVLSMPSRVVLPSTSLIGSAAPSVTGKGIVSQSMRKPGHGFVLTWKVISGLPQFLLDAFHSRQLVLPREGELTLAESWGGHSC